MTHWATIWTPMLASNPRPGETAQTLAADDAYSFERKFDGVRAILSWNGERVRLFTRARSRDIAAQFPEIVNDVHTYARGERFVLDGELMLAGQDEGDLRLRHLLGRVNSRPPRVGLPVQHEAIYHAFDILQIGDVDVTARTLLERRNLRDQQLEHYDGAHVERVLAYTHKLAEFERGRALGHEGVVAKRTHSPYRQGRRSSEWVKLKHRFTLTCIAYGTTESTSSSRPFGALLLAMLAGGRPQPVGQVGSGLSGAEMTAVRATLDEGRFPLVEVTCMGRTADGLREPVFDRLLPDAEFDDAGLSQLDDVPLH